MNILKEGVKSALVRIVRLIVYSIIVLVVFYVIGLITSHKASALTYNGNLWEPDMSNKSQTYVFGPNNSSNWFYFGFNTSWYNGTDYDLLAFRLNKNVAQVQDWSGYNNHIEQFYTLQAILWDDNNYGIPCFRSNDWLDTFFCPITKGTSYHGFTIMANVFDPVANENLELQLLLEQNRYFVNYDSTDIITYFSGSGGITGMVIVQQQTNDILEDTKDVLEDTKDVLEDTNEYITDTSITGAETQTNTALTGISADFNDILNGWGGEWSDLTHVILEPINVILYAFDSNTTCQPIVLQVPYMQNKSITLPCLSGIYNQYFGTFISIFVVGISGLYGYRTIIYVIRTIKEVLDAENDKIEVIDL